MKKLTTIFCISFCLTAFGQKGITYVRKGSESLIDKKFEKVIGTEWRVFTDGAEPGWYYKVEYDYGEPPPQYHELIKSFYNNGFPDTIRGWVVTKQKEFSIGGDYPCLSFDLVQTCTNKRNSRLPVYVETMIVNMSSDGFSIKIFTSKEEMSRREKIILEKETR